MYKLTAQTALYTLVTAYNLRPRTYARVFFPALPGSECLQNFPVPRYSVFQINHKL